MTAHYARRFRDMPSQGVLPLLSEVSFRAKVSGTVSEEGWMSRRECQILGCSEPASEPQVELRVPLDQMNLSQETVRTFVCERHRQRFVDAGMVIRELSVSR